jgi:hypothetical protein
MGIGLTAATAAMMKPAAAQTAGYKDTTPWPGVVVREYDGETPSLIPGFKTVSMRDIIMQPGSKTMGPPMMNAMICHITEGNFELSRRETALRPRRILFGPATRRQKSKHSMTGTWSQL